MSTPSAPNETEILEDADMDMTCYQSLIVLVDALHDAMELEADHQKKYEYAKDAVQYRRDEVALSAYRDGAINGANERHKKLQETSAISNDSAANFLQDYEAQAFDALTLAVIERKSLETQVSLTKAWLYSRSGIR